MDTLNYKEAIEKLRRAGLTASEMGRLERFRRRFVVGESDQSPVEHYRLEFVRWLVVTHRLSDHIG